jgi:hypothetical protein
MLQHRPVELEYTVTARTVFCTAGQTGVALVTVGRAATRRHRTECIAFVTLRRRPRAARFSGLDATETAETEDAAERAPLRDEMPLALLCGAAGDVTRQQRLCGRGVDDDADEERRT